MGGCTCMPLSQRSGLSPRPSGGATTRRWNGLETKTSTPMKNRTMAARVPMPHGASALSRLHMRHAAAALNRLSIQVQKRSEPSCPPHKAETVRPSGMERLEVSATKAIEKSRLRKPAVSAATASVTTAASTTAALRAASVKSGPRRQTARPLVVSWITATPNASPSARRPTTTRSITAVVPVRSALSPG